MNSRKLSVFNFTTLNGFYKATNGDTSWHKHGEEEAAFAAESAGQNNALMFGRITYELMASFWPTEMGMQMAPAVAEGMNKAEKFVISTTLTQASWQNTTIINGNIIDEVTALKQSPGSNITILGSGSIVAQLAEANLIDEYGIMIDPVALGDGTPLFKGMQRQLDLKLVNTRTFKSGVILATYQPA